MYCLECDQEVGEDRWGKLIHVYQDFDTHYPVVDDEFDAEDWIYE
jgi:hypothetical protein